ncbi:MAG: glycosyl hydrolase 108 family protein [Hyphomicrobium sp.]
MQENFDTALKSILTSEGFYTPSRGWTDDPVDNGGPTLAGVTYNEYCRYIGRPDLIRNDKNWDQSVKDALRAMPDEHIANYYRKVKWDVVRGDELPPGVDLAVCDVCVLHGPGKGRQFYRRVLGLGDSMKPFSDDDIRTVWTDNVNWDAVIEAIGEQRLQHYAAICARNPSQNRFLKGWTNRARRTTAQCCDLAPDRSGQSVPSTEVGRTDDHELVEV